MMDPFAFFTALLALGFALLSRKNAQDRIASLETDLDGVEHRNRQLVEEREATKVKLVEASAALEATKKALEATEKEKQEIDRQRATITEAAARLEKVRAELEADLARLRREHESLEFRVVEFQGTWSHQLTTLEAEISTLMRQLGEFRKGTQLPFTRPDLATPLPPPRLAAVAAPGADLASAPVRRVP
jgi:chromosome segregation ATPase